LVDVDETTLWEKAPRGGIGYGWYLADVSQSDTITFDNFDKLLFAKAVKLEDNSEVTVTLATNKVTISTALSSDKILIGIIGI